MKRLSALLLVAILVFSTTFPYMAQENTINHEEQLYLPLHDYLVARFGEDFVENHNRSMEIAMNLYDLFPTTRTGEVMYPNDFAGLFIDCNGNLVVLVVEDKDTPVAINSLVGNIRGNSDILMMSASFSYNELMALLNYLGDSLFDENSVYDMSNVTAMELDVINNTVVVYLLYYSYDEIVNFQNAIINSPMITFRQGDVAEMDICLDFDNSLSLNYEAANFEPLNVSSFSIHPGQRIYLMRGSVLVSSGSVGFRATRAGRVGFTTAAHLGLGDVAGTLRTGDIIVDSLRRHVGTVDTAQLNRYDTAFVSLAPNVFMTNSVYTATEGAVLPQTRPNIIGSLVIMDGSTSGRRNIGIILTTTWLGNIGSGGVSFPVNNIARASVPAQPGDSGGIVYSYLQANHIPLFGVNGMVISKFASDGSNDVLFTRVENVLFIFGMTLQ